MDNLEGFDAYNLSAWKTSAGLLKPFVRAVSKHVKRAQSFVVTVAASALIGATSISSGFAAPIPNSAQAELLWPAMPTPELTKRQLSEALEAIKSLRPHWNGGGYSPLPTTDSVKAAELILPELPGVIADAKAGVDEYGNVYFKLIRGGAVAYLTIESKQIHLLCMRSGRENVYIDDEPFKKKLPSNVKKALSATFT